MFKIVISCEHGGHQIPERYKDLFIHYQDVLESHQGWDIGALSLAKHLADMADYFFYSEISRLLIDLNRSINHPRLFSFITRSLSKDEKNLIIERYFYPYRTEVSQAIQNLISQGNRVLHISVHTFTPFLGVPRQNDIGFLYDPKRLIEKRFNHLWKMTIQNMEPHLKIRFNYPYRGLSDGFVNHFRKIFSENVYVCSELEINQNFFLSGADQSKKLKALVTDSFSNLMQELNTW